MNDRLNPAVARRDLLRMLAVGAVAASTSACAVVEAGDFPDRGKARYRADSPEVQTFYRVNSYPTN